MNRPTSYTLLAPTNHWRRVGDAWGRDWIARRPDGTLCTATVRDEAAA